MPQKGEESEYLKVAEEREESSAPAFAWRCEVSVRALSAAKKPFGTYMTSLKAGIESGRHGNEKCFRIFHLLKISALSMK
jgi:hypothetical protein